MQSNAMLTAQALPTRIDQFTHARSGAPHRDMRHVIGDYAEDTATALYRMARFDIHAVDTRIAGVQIDLIAVRNSVFHIVEVKYRKTIAYGHHAITNKQIARLAEAADFLVRAGRTQKVQIDYVLFDHAFNWQRIDNIDVTGHIH